MSETIKWIIIRQLIKWNVLAVSPVYANHTRMPARRRVR